MEQGRLQIMKQGDAYSSPWPLRTRFKVLFWNIAWLFLFRPTPKHFYHWRLFLLRLFGCKMSGRPYVAPSAVIKMPWNLKMEDHACLGPQSEVYNLGKVTLRARCTISQQAYLCAGTHDFTDTRLPLVVGTIEIGKDAFIGARAFILPAVSVGEGVVIGACSVVTRDMPAWTICAGNPCKPLRLRA